MNIADGCLDPFARQRGDGSRNCTDDWLDESSIFDNEWGSSAATTFKPDDTDAAGNSLSERKQDKFEELYSHHNGWGESSRKGDVRWSHILNDARMFMSVLEMPEYQRERVTTILQDIDISSNNFGGRQYEVIILALCSLVSDKAMSKRQNPDIDDRLFLKDEFRELMDSVDMSSRELRKTRAAIRERTEYFGYTE